MKTQQDNKVRMVSLENLRAMCDHVSGMCHRFEVAKVSRSRVTVTYSNPDEYGNVHPVSCVFPCYPSNWPQDDHENPRVLIDPLRLYGPDASWDMFWPVESCPSLYRDYVPTDNPITTMRERWRSHADILRDQGKTTIENKTNGKCPSCYLCDVKE